MSEKIFFSFLGMDKTITNPINKTEVMSCNEIYKDYKLCRALYKKGLKTKHFCKDLRHMGIRCFLFSEEDFERYLVKKFDEKKKYIQYLDQEGSILFNYYKSDPTIFSLKQIDNPDENRVDFNEILLRKEN